MKLDQLFSGIAAQVPREAASVEVRALAVDSRKVESGVDCRSNDDDLSTLIRTLGILDDRIGMLESQLAKRTGAASAESEPSNRSPNRPQPIKGLKCLIV